MLHADQLVVVHHDDTVSRFTGVRYTIGRAGLLIVTTTGTEIRIAAHDILTTHALLAHTRFRPVAAARAA